MLLLQCGSYSKNSHLQKESVSDICADRATEIEDQRTGSLNVPFKKSHLLLLVSMLVAVRVLQILL